MKVVIKRAAVEESLLRRCLSQREAAKLCNISSGYMTQLLLGTRRPSGAMRKKLMKGLRMKFDELFEIVEDEAK